MRFFSWIQSLLTLLDELVQTLDQAERERMRRWIGEGATEEQIDAALTESRIYQFTGGLTRR